MSVIDEDLKRRLLKIHTTAMLLHPVFGLMLLYAASSAGVRGYFFSSRTPIVVALSAQPYSFSVLSLLFLGGAIFMFVGAAQGMYHRRRLNEPECGLPFRLPAHLRRRIVLLATLIVLLSYLGALVFLR